MKNLMKVNGKVNIAGVYAMYIQEGDEKKYLYIGSAIECNNALSRHLHYLKRGLYVTTNKAILQQFYDISELNFEVIHESVLNSKLADMSLTEKENVQKSLEIMEKMYIDLFKDTICNKQFSVTKHSSNRNNSTTYKRRKNGIGTNNKNCKYTEEMIREIIWLKQNTDLKHKEIADLINKQYNVKISAKYIYNIANIRWIHLTELKPEWFREVA